MRAANRGTWLPNLIPTFACVLLLAECLFAHAAAPAVEAPKAILVQAVLSEDSSEQMELIKRLIGADDELVPKALTAWRVSELFIFTGEDGAKIPLILDSAKDSEGRSKAIRLSDGQFLKSPEGSDALLNPAALIPADTTSRLRRAIKTTLDLYSLGNPAPRMRRDAVVKLGQERNAEYIPHFQARLKVEQDKEVRKALNEAIALTRTVSDDEAVRIEAIDALAEMRSINALSFLKELRSESAADPSKYGEATTRTAHQAVLAIENYIRMGNLFGTAFRGLSLAAVLLVAALGLAITFGLMGVINMAHGEVIAVGAYTTFMVQQLFGPGLTFSPLGYTMKIKGLGLTGFGLDLYFVVAVAASFFMGALVGLALERGIIRFLYKRPLESLLATWGVSLVLQQVFRHTFGAANVQVSSPAWLSGSLVLRDVLFAYNRLFIITFAVAIVAGTWLILTRTSLGLQVRAVMQNRAMASCVGVKTDRVNMMTFAFGSGLAGMAGACLSQIANVGPSLGQSYIVDCFMIVVLGGVGNLVGTVSASLGVGVTDQILQPWLGAVMGKITVLAAIILFLQWRPAGLFVTRSRSLDG